MTVELVLEGDEEQQCFLAVLNDYWRGIPDNMTVQGFIANLPDSLRLKGRSLGSDGMVVFDEVVSLPLTFESWMIARKSVAYVRSHGCRPEWTQLVVGSLDGLEAKIADLELPLRVDLVSV